MKRYVADTHAVLWFAGGRLGNLGRRARTVFSTLGTGRSEILVSVVSLWEVAMLHDEGAIRLPAGFTAWCEALSSMEGIRIEPLLLADVEQARSLRGLGDSNDRLIAGTALRSKVELITADERLRNDKRVATIW